MEMVRYCTLLAVLMVAVSVGSGQSEEESSGRNLDTRTVSIYTGIGFLELIAFGVQNQINPEFALGAKVDAAILSGSGPGIGLPLSRSGGGIKGSYFFSRAGEGTFLSINVLNFEGSYIRSHGDRGTSFELTVGHDSIEGRGIGVLWLIGLARGESESASYPSLIFPAVKIGVHVDL